MMADERRESMRVYSTMLVVPPPPPPPPLASRTLVVEVVLVTVLSPNLSYLLTTAPLSRIAFASTPHFPFVSIRHTKSKLKDAARPSKTEDSVEPCEQCAFRIKKFRLTHCIVHNEANHERAHDFAKNCSRDALASSPALAFCVRQK